MNKTKHLLTNPTLLKSSGRFASLLDMGGVPTAATNTRINVGKNNKVKAVALDFHLITRSIEQRRREAEKQSDDDKKLGRGEDSRKGMTDMNVNVKPDLSLVEKMANLLNVKLGDSSPIGQRREDEIRDDTDEDLASKLLGNKKNSDISSSSQTVNKPLKSSGPHTDIRSKYASKLRNKIEGGVAGIDLMNYERTESSKRGDASSHLAAKALIAGNESSNNRTASNPSSSRWLATTGVGQLLSFLTQRSMQIVLLPIPSTVEQPQTEQDRRRNEEEMDSLTKQLPHVQFDLCVSDGRRRDPSRVHDDTARDILDYVISELDDSIAPLQYALVSDRDDYLRSAREKGMFTIRVRPKNRRRGDVTASYSVEDVAGVEEVINEINGISFNSALKR